MTKAIESALFTVAMYETALGISQNVYGMEKFCDYYARSLPPGKVKLIKEWIKLKKTSQKELAKAMDDTWGKTGETAPAP